jgi:hypothetical protein
MLSGKYNHLIKTQEYYLRVKLDEEYMRSTCIIYHNCVWIYKSPKIKQIFKCFYEKNILIIKKKKNLDYSQIASETLSWKYLTQKRLLEWLKM